jgi:hypothetical protein
VAPRQCGAPVWKKFRVDAPEFSEFAGLVGILFLGCLCGNIARLNSIGGLLEAFRQAAQFLGLEWIRTSRGAPATV